MTNDKKLVEVWQSEFESLDELESFNFSKDDFGRYTSSLTDGRWQGFLLAKRSQPSVVLPKRIYSYPMHARKEIQDSITAAGIKYTTGE